MAKEIVFQWILIFSILQVASISAQKAVYIVHMDMSLMPQIFSDHHSWFSATLSSLSNPMETATPAYPLYSYKNVMHGFCASLTSQELQLLERSKGFVSAIRDRKIVLDTTYTPDFLGLTPSFGAWLATDSGSEVIIGVVDTGIWPESASFRDHGYTEIPKRWKGICQEGTQFNKSMCNKKLIGARYFNKGLIASDPNLTLSMNSPRDTDGHGTHTSSTAAGSYVEGISYYGYAAGTARGTAPKARLAMYKVIWGDIGSSADVIVGIDQAISDGVDVLSLSFGLDSLPLYEDPVAIASFAAMEKGITVVTSAGNRGPDLGSLHNGIPWVVTVSASTTDREFEGIITLGTGKSINGQTLFHGNLSSLHGLPLVFIKKCNNKNELRLVRQKIVVCPDNDGDLSSQVDTVRSSGVVAGLFISNNSDPDQIQFTFPAMIVTPSDGNFLIDYIQNSTNPIASLEFQRTVVGKIAAPSVPSYSARGPSPSSPNILKPDITAPGTLILAAWPSNVPQDSVGSRSTHEDFKLLSGTSMACPHVSGIAALLKAAHPDWSPAAIRSAMMTTSLDVDNEGLPIKDPDNNNNPATPFVIGAGHIDPNKAMDPGLIYDAGREDYIKFLCTLNYTKSQVTIITKNSSYDCSNSSPDLNYPSIIAFFDPKNRSKSFQNFHRTVTHLGSGASTYSAKSTSTEKFTIRVSPEKLVFTEKNEKKSFIVTVESQIKEENVVKFGSLIWIEERGSHKAKSPIVVTTLSLPLIGP